QAAAVRALQDPDYYRARYEETHQFRLGLQQRLAGVGWSVFPGCANFLLACLPAVGPDARHVGEGCQTHGRFLRDAANMGSRLGDRGIRIAVKDRELNVRMIKILHEVLAPAPGESRLSLQPVA